MKTTAATVDILMVEDDPFDLELALRALRQAGLTSQVQVAADGAEALDYLFGEGAWAGRSSAVTPRLVLLDLKLPKVDGLEVLRRIKGDPRTRTAPVVVLTSSHQQRDIAESYELGVNSYIVKPVNFERFSAAVQELGRYWMRLNQAPQNAS